MEGVMNEFINEHLHLKHTVFNNIYQYMQMQQTNFANYRKDGNNGLLSLLLLFHSFLAHYS